MIICPRCHSVANWNSYFQKYMCSSISCGHMFNLNEYIITTNQAAAKLKLEQLGEYWESAFTGLVILKTDVLLKDLIAIEGVESVRESMSGNWLFKGKYE